MEPSLAGQLDHGCLWRYLNLAIWNEFLGRNNGSAIHWIWVGKYQLYPVRHFISMETVSNIFFLNINSKPISEIVSYYRIFHAKSPTSLFSLFIYIWQNFCYTWISVKIIFRYSKSPQHDVHNHGEQSHGTFGVTHPDYFHFCKYVNGHFFTQATTWYMDRCTAPVERLISELK